MYKNVLEFRDTDKRVYELQIKEGVSISRY